MECFHSALAVVLRTLFRACLFCDGPAEPSQRTKQPKHDTYQRLLDLVDSERVVFHGSQIYDIAVLEPRTCAKTGGGTDRLLCATDNPIHAFAHAFKKVIEPRNPQVQARISPIIRGGFYRFPRSTEPSLKYSFVSIHERLPMLFHMTSAVCIYICDRERFQLVDDHRLTAITAGRCRSTSVWTSRYPVVPLDKILLRICDLPCGYSLHGEGAGQLGALVSYRARRRSHVQSKDNLSQQQRRNDP
jgi:hypothetical protein